MGWEGIVIVVLAPVALYAQEFEFQLQSEAFPVEINGWQLFSPWAGGFSESAPDFADIDSDGDYDLFIGERWGKIWFYENVGTPDSCDFVLVSSNFDSIDVGDYSSPEFADIDGDGDYDLFVGREPAGYFGILGDVYFYRNEGTPTTAQFELVTTNYLTADVGWISINPQVVDLNGDQAPDLVVGATNILTYFENVGDSLSPGFTLMEEQFQGIYVPAIKPFFVDIDADGDYDLICREGVLFVPPTIALYLNTGTPQSPVLELYDPAFVTNPDFFVNANPGLADIDADGDFDLFVSDDDGHFFFYQNVGDPYWPRFILDSSQWQGIQFFYPHDGWRGFCFADLDEDGDLDLLTQSPTDYNLSFYRNTGTPQMANMVLDVEILFPNLQFMPCPRAIDIDLDGDLDFFCGEVTGGIMFFRNVTGEPPAVPPLVKHPQAGYHLSIGPNPAIRSPSSPSPCLIPRELPWQCIIS